MQLKDYISKEVIAFTDTASSKKKALEILSESLASQSEQLNKNKLLDALLAREKLGSTALGKGIAIPHCRIEDLDNIYLAILKLDEAVEFEATDELPVNFIVGIVVPEDANDEHLKLLASLAELLDDDSILQSIQNCTDQDCIFRLLSVNPKHLAA